MVSLSRTVLGLRYLVELGIEGDVVLPQPLLDLSLSRAGCGWLHKAARVIGRIVHHQHRLALALPLRECCCFGTRSLEPCLEDLEADTFTSWVR